MPDDPPVELPLEDSPLSPRMPAHPVRPSATASKPARIMLWCFCFMINSLWWMFIRMRDDASCHLD